MPSEFRLSVEAAARRHQRALACSLLFLLSGCGGGSGSAGSSPTPPTPTLSSITVAPQTGTSTTTYTGDTLQLTATATYSNGSTQNVSSTATWSSSNASFATVSTSGLVTGVAAGQVTISAAVSGVSGPEMVTVDAKTLASINVSPANPTLAIGISQQFVAIGTYNDGSTSDVTKAVTWSSSNPALASVATSGVVVTIAQGAPDIIATSGTIQGSTTVTIPNATGGLVLNTNPTDSLVLKGTDSNGALVSFYGTRDQNGLPQSFFAISAEQTDGSMQSVELDQNGHIITGYDTLGFNYIFQWFSDTQGVVTLSTNDGMGTVSTSFDLGTSGSSTVAAHRRKLQEEGTAMAGMKSGPGHRQYGTQSTSTPNPFESPITVATSCQGENIPETNATVTVSAATGGGSLYSSWVYNQGNGNYLALFPSLALATDATVAAQQATADAAESGACTSVQQLDSLCDTIEAAIALVPPAEAVPFVGYTTAVCKYGVTPSNYICEATEAISSSLDDYLDTPITLTVAPSLGAATMPPTVASVLATGPYPSFSFVFPCPDVASVNVLPASATIASGGFQPLTATALNPNGQIIQSNAIAFEWAVDQSQPYVTTTDWFQTFSGVPPSQNPISGVSSILAVGVSPGGPVNVTVTENSSAKQGTANVTVLGGLVGTSWDGTYQWPTSCTSCVQGPQSMTLDLSTSTMASASFDDTLADFSGTIGSSTFALTSTSTNAQGTWSLTGTLANSLVTGTVTFSCSCISSGSQTGTFTLSQDPPASTDVPRINHD